MQGDASLEVPVSGVGRKLLILTGNENCKREMTNTETGLSEGKVHAEAQGGVSVNSERPCFIAAEVLVYC